MSAQGVSRTPVWAWRVGDTVLLAAERPGWFAGRWSAARGNGSVCYREWEAATGVRLDEGGSALQVSVGLVVLQEAVRPKCLKDVLNHAHEGQVFRVRGGGAEWIVAVCQVDKHVHRAIVVPSGNRLNEDAESRYEVLECLGRLGVVANTP